MRPLLRFALLVLALLVGGVALLVVALTPPDPSPSPAAGATLAGVTLIEPGVPNGRRPQRTLEISEGRISAIGDSSPSDTGVFSGNYVLPGLTDMHVHFPPASIAGQGELFSFLFLYHGVTAVRDAADVDGTASAPVREGIAAGRFPGPRVFSCGPLVDGPDAIWGNSRIASTPEQGRQAVAEIADEGFECIKVYNDLDAETLAAIQDEARKRQLPVIGHVPLAVPYQEARLGDAQHLIGFPPPYGEDTPPFPYVLEAWRRLSPARLEAMIDASLEHRIANTPTLVTIDSLLRSRDYDQIRLAPEMGLLPRYYRDVIWNPVGGMSVSGGLSDSDWTMIEEAQQVMFRTVERLHERGAALHSGTDALIPFVVPGASLHRELRLLVEAGLSPEEALEISTRNSAEYLGGPALGRIEVGAPAELVLFREDPTQSLDALDSITGVVRDGRLYSREFLDEQLQSYRDFYDSILYDSLMTPIVRRVLAATRPSAEETDSE